MVIQILEKGCEQVSTIFRLKEVFTLPSWLQFLKKRNMTTPLIDEPERSPQRLPIARRVAIGFEIALWLLTLVGLFLKLESWEGGSEILILTFSILMCCYLALPVLIFGSKGVRQHLGAHAVGIALSLGLMGWLFRIEAWEGGHEMSIISFPLVALLLLTCIVLWVTRKEQPEKSRFYRNAVFRLLPLTAFLALFF